MGMVFFRSRIEEKNQSPMVVVMVMAKNKADA